MRSAHARDKLYDLKSTGCKISVNRCKNVFKEVPDIATTMHNNMLTMNIIMFITPVLAVVVLVSQ